ncbi:NAD dependent epimerase/dehydratase, putative [Talaromyces stipitatus ATCC 10500]|uniref:NAD dependent epimerase/dehydratase, putative n=1 Tax=Talaromyces stipitatus (strain ATCC 10500 / CBS 375.48 / QM 6759 / NRRL 1006) TaxID=441959 RepID=B8MBG4_TALSN|nr:NAD dependent epimerase/dehydratase, putative [Talaromyces stipitatus ATCC 10500]EED17828.1 NAD dependent epimerase/dehydratase, putative [Talaromyces stipitatus ATCC 10500]
MASNSDLGVVLVVGGCGYLGSNLVKMLQEEPTCTAIHVISRTPTQNLHPGVTYHAGDISDARQVADLFTKINPRVVFHTASPKDIAPESLLRKTNIEGTRNLLKAARETKSTRAFIYTGSDSALEQMPGVKQTEETAKLYTERSKDANPYAKSKAIADAEVQAANTSLTLTTAVIRIPGLYGENDDNCVGTLLETITRGEHNVQVGDNKPIFEFVYVKKACEAHILAAKRILEGRLNGGQAFFISDGVSLPYFDFARKLYAGAGHLVPPDQIKVMPLWLVVGIAKLGEWLYWAFTFNTKFPKMRSQRIRYLAGGCQWDVSKAREQLGYEPVTDQDAVLKKVAQAESIRLGIKNKRIPTAINMGHHAQGQIERILDRGRSLVDLSADGVIELRRHSEQSIAIDKFKVSSAYNDIRGGPGWIHEDAAALIGKFLGLLRDRLSAATDSRYFLTGSKNCLLAGESDCSSKQADASLMKSGTKWPVVALEVGISETTTKLYDDANRWLKGSSGQTKHVILVDVQEKGRPDTSNDKWDLSEVDFLETRRDRLSDHILQWYQSQGIQLVGNFKLSVHLWYSDKYRQCILNEAAFSPGKLIDLTTIQDAPFEIGLSHA